MNYKSTLRTLRLLPAVAVAALSLLGSTSAQAQNHAVGGRGTLLSTTDLGKTWKVTQRGTQDFEAIYKLGKDSVWVAGGTEIYRSLNGGDTLGRVGGKGSVTFSDLTIFPNGRGIAYERAFSTHPINNLLSTNFGATWVDDNNNLGTSQGASHVRGTSTAWSLWGDGRNIYKTTNSGINWTNQFNVASIRSTDISRSRTIMVGEFGQAYAGGTSATRLSQLALPNVGTTRLNKVRVSPNDSVVIVVGNAGYAARSTDGGITWDRINFAIGNLNFVEWASSTVVFAGGAEDSQGILPLFRSTDAGATWERQPLTVFGTRQYAERDLYTMHMATPLVGYLSAGWRSNTNENAMFRTTDGGSSWVEIQGPRENRNVSCIHVFSRDTLLASHFNVFSAGEISRSTDGGLTWSLQGGGREGKYGFWFTSRNEGYVVGENGLSRTTNGGISWTVVDVQGSTTPLYDIRKGVLVGAFGKAFRTLDYATFAEMAPLGFIAGTFRDVQAVSLDTAYVVGDRATAFRTFNGGASWQYIGDTLKTVNLKAVHFTSVANGWAVANNGQLLRTSDSARTWMQSTVANRNLNDIYFLNPNTGIIVGDSGLVLTTTDAGANWTRVYAGTRQSLYRAWMGDTLNRANTKTIAFAADTAEGFAGEVVSVPVRVKDFNRIRGFQGTITWDSTVARYVTTSDFRLPNLALRNFNNATAANQGELRFNWIGPDTAVTLADTSIIFSVNFRLRTATRTSSPVMFAGSWQLGATDSTRTTVSASAESGELRVRTSPGLITRPTIVNGVADTNVCAGGTIRIPFVVSESFAAGNTFRAQLSDATGSFATSTNLGTAVAGVNGDTLTVTIPANTPPSGTYRIRVVASLPVVNGTETERFISVNAVPARPTITAGGPLAVCPNDSLLLSAPAGFAGYTWNNGETTQSIWVKTAGGWSVSVTSAAGCVSQVSTVTNTTQGTQPAAPSITATGSTTRCEGDSVTLTAPNANAYRWSTGATTRSIRVGTAGAYTVQTRATATGCFSQVSAPTTVVINPLPDTATITVYGPSNDSLRADVAGTSYIWLRNGTIVPGLTTQQIKWTQAGNWTVRVVSNGCTSAVSAPVTVTFLGGTKLVGNISLFPNPNSGNFTLQLDGMNVANVDLTITDLAGRALHSETLSTATSQHSLNLSGVAPGTYIVRLAAPGNGTSLLKMVVR